VSRDSTPDFIKLWPRISRIANRFGASVVTPFNGRVTLALNVGGVESKGKTYETEQRQQRQHLQQYDPLLSPVISWLHDLLLLIKIPIFKNWKQSAHSV
jgi:hypothetical protein